jgi:hypothetical protein
MRIFEIAYPTEDGDMVEILTDDDIRQQYYPYWCQKMIMNVPNADLSLENCIEDWCIVHWAVEIKIPV